MPLSNEDIELIDQIEQFNLIEYGKPTFLEVMEVNWKELIYSRVLAFLFDSQQSHQFGDLFLRTLLEVYYEKICNSSGLDHLNSDLLTILKRVLENNITTLSVKKEENTDNKKRIDIVIRTEDLIISIENKISASIQNDLSEYNRHITDPKNNEGKTNLNILLSLHEITNEQELTKMKKSSFINITYKKFFDQFDQNIGARLNHEVSYFLHYVLDFKTTILNLNEVEKLNKETIEFFIQNWSKVDSVNKKIVDFFNWWERQRKSIQERIAGNIHREVKYYPKDKSIHCEIPLLEYSAEFNVVIDFLTDIDKPYYRISFGRLHGNSNKEQNFDMDKLNRYIEKLEVVFKEAIQELGYKIYVGHIYQDHTKESGPFKDRKAIFIESGHTKLCFSLGNQEFIDLFIRLYHVLSDPKTQKLFDE
jgi:hypothetical protein